MNKRPRTIQIFLPSGDPSGIRIAEQTTSIIRLIEVPRSEMAEFVKMPESKQVGLYFLVSGDNKEECYIGQSGDVGSRLMQHHKDEKKDWERALVLISLTNNLTQTHVLYLESLSIEKAKSCQRYDLLNGNGGQKPHTPIPLKADCDEIHDIGSLLLATLGYPIFEPLTEPTMTKAEQTFICNRAGVDAKGIYTSEGMVVLRGSSAPMTTKRKTEQRFYDKRDELLAKGVVNTDGQRFVFQRDYLFRTPSGASMFLLLATSNGWVDWKTDKGVTLHDYQGRTLESASEQTMN
ncbi:MULTISPECIES: GIY-YIG nuclease family protein [Vibrio harveyi group]|uniref:GIY-YIG nuclease family protein n=1 Tax=Vibrio harveyi group TaxID=717610 RepID=UPI001124B148|nr:MULTISPECIES: GIY-YIG nuclease family protein [Vibrio harveyi group]MCS0234005.1 GIY-YIG nuclease family protein [Vibrio alginolyticus]MCS0273438.1 GIY-YIG nuclease family protein [Vibrio alginolyticus]MCS0324949.1 GIY-YIG nuclease family protein [Vibrio diabolicus]TOH66764.1 endonuclease [Vibrio parahaemolyticus]